MLNKAVPWVIFAGVLGLLVFSGSSFVQGVDWFLWPVRFGLIAGFSLLVVWSRWRHRRDQVEKHQAVRKDAADEFLSAVRRWFHGARKPGT